MGWTATVCCLEALALSHCWQFLTHAVTSLLRPRHITLVAMSRLVARVTAWASPWKAANTAGRSTSGTSGLTPPPGDVTEEFHSADHSLLYLKRC